MESEYIDSRKLDKDAPFHLDPNYYTNQLEREIAEAQKQLRMQMAGFEQLQDQYNQRIDTIISFEKEIEKMRTEMREHEKLAVDHQLVVDEFTEFKKLLPYPLTDYDNLLADLRKTRPDAGKPLAGPTYHSTEWVDPHQSTDNEG